MPGMSCLRVVDRRALVTLLLCAGAVRALTGVPTTLGPAVSSAEIPKKVSHPAGLRLTFAERVAYQRAIEEVRWRHRIWPKDNPQPKPSLDAILPRAQLEKKVEDYLRESQLVADERGRPISASELQAEMDRIVRHTRRPEMLRELFAALGNDPFLIAECLARPIMAQRLVSEPMTNAKDTSFQAESRNPAVRLIRDSTGSFDFAQDDIGLNLENVAYTLPEIPTDCTDDTWAATTIVNVPDAREGHTAVWTGSEMIVWGGAFTHNVYYFFNTGGRYDPTIDAWIATSTTNAPIARWLHTAVWTGSEMIVWAGGDNTDFLNTGGRYNPATDTWTSTTITNAPIARVHSTAVWTTGEMIVWGGYNYTNGRFNSGGRYNPGTDSWVPTSTINAPEARWAHTAVWTGSEMIVWGGTNETNALHTGGKYNPSVDSWTATGTEKVPLGRIDHTAVWTGGEMIVWGGFDETSNYTNTGGKYNPSADSWAATSLENAQSPRADHTAVWTGSEMIIWGGIFCCPAVDFNTGGKYNAGTDSWTATTTANVPFGRYAHTAVWTGSEMIVWGGYNYELQVFFNTGGRYCAPSGPTPTPTSSPTATPAPTATPTATATVTPRMTPTPRPRPTPRRRP
jgi:N-acetylneuraminic acid mutarotase